MWWRRYGFAAGLVLLCASCSLHSARGEPAAELTLYAESLCPYCTAFTTTQLGPLIRSGVGDLVRIRFVPWGNVRYHDNNGTWSCQHGELECQYNMLFSCALNYYPRQDDWFPYVECVEQSAREAEGRDVNALHTKCSDKAGLNTDRIGSCAHSKEGIELQLEAKRQTDALDPPHTGVPWVTFTGKASPKRQAVPLFDLTDYVRTVVCAAYEGPKKLPPICYEEEHPPSAGTLRRTPKTDTAGLKADTAEAR